MLVVGEPPQSPEGRLAAAVCETCAAVGAHVSIAPPGVDPTAEAGPRDGAAGADPGASGDGDTELERILAAAPRVNLLAVDGAGLLAGALARGGGGPRALGTCMASVWEATRVVVNRAFLAEGETSSAEGERIVYLTPPADGGEHSDAVRAGLENLARTLSVEWARHGITTVAVAPGDLAEDAAVAEAAAVTAYLASAAGAYFSGCLLDLRGV